MKMNFCKQSDLWCSNQNWRGRSAASPARTAGGSGYPRHARGAGGAARDEIRLQRQDRHGQLQIEEFGAALDMYKLEVGRHPNTQEGLQALVEAPGGATNWNGPT